MVFLLKNIDNSSVVPADVYTKPFAGPIICRSTKLINGFIFYPTIDTEKYQLMRLHEFVVN